MTISEFLCREKKFLFVFSTSVIKIPIFIQLSESLNLLSHIWHKLVEGFSVLINAEYLNFQTGIDAIDTTMMDDAVKSSLESENTFNAKEALKDFDRIENQLLEILQIADRTTELLSTAPVGIDQSELTTLSQEYFSIIAAVNCDLSRYIPQVIVPLNLINTDGWSKIEEQHRTAIIEGIQEQMKQGLQELHQQENLDV